MECGLPPAAALHAATGLAAEAVGLEQEIGIVAAGKRADLLVLSGNPLRDINCIKKVVTVFKDGKEYLP